MSHVVGEVTYVELFKDAEGKSRVSDVANLLHEVLNVLSRLILIKCSFRFCSFGPYYVTELEIL